MYEKYLMLSLVHTAIAQNVIYSYYFYPQWSLDIRFLPPNNLPLLQNLSVSFWHYVPLYCFMIFIGILYQPHLFGNELLENRDHHIVNIWTPTMLQEMCRVLVNMYLMKQVNI